MSYLTSSLLLIVDRVFKLLGSKAKGKSRFLLRFPSSRDEGRKMPSSGSPLHQPCSMLLLFRLHMVKIRKFWEVLVLFYISVTYFKICLKLFERLAIIPLHTGAKTNFLK